MSKIRKILNELDEAYELDIPDRLILLKDIIDLGYFEFESGKKPSSDINDYILTATPVNIKKYGAVPYNKRDEDSESAIYPKNMVLTYTKEGYVDSKGLYYINIPAEIYDAGEGIYWKSL